MKNRTDRMLLRAFLVSLLAYGILLFIYIQCIWKGTITSSILDALEQLFFWLAVGGHAVPFFALQLLLCRRNSACAVYGIHRLWKKRISQPQGNSHSVL